MRIPKSLESLAEDGVIQEVLRPLMSGKEAQIYLVMTEEGVCAAKIYKDADRRSFKNRADYTEGRKVRNSRDQRAMDKGTKYGKGQDEDAWKSTEVEMIYRLRAAGVTVPEPFLYMDGVLLMELVCDWDGNPAPRLGDLEFTAQEATEVYHQLLREVVRMLCAGVVHGDLSDFNVLFGADGPVVIDFPQSVSAAGNLNAKKLLLRDVNNLHRFYCRWVPGARPKPYGEEIWELYESNRLTPDTPLTGRIKRSAGPVDTRAVLELISDANRDEARRRQAAGQSTAGLDSARPAPRRREFVVEKPAPRPRPQASARASGGPSRGGPPRGGPPHGGPPHGGAPHGGAPRGGSPHGGPPHGSAPRNGPPRGGPPLGTKSGPKRGDQVIATTYVSPEAKKLKGRTLSLTPRAPLEADRSRGLSGNGPSAQGKREESEPGSTARRKRRRRRRGGGPPHAAAAQNTAAHNSAATPNRAAAPKSGSGS